MDPLWLTTDAMREPPIGVMRRDRPSVLRTEDCAPLNVAIGGVTPSGSQSATRDCEVPRMINRAMPHCNGG